MKHLFKSGLLTASICLTVSAFLLPSCSQEEPLPQTVEEQSPIERMLGEFKASVTPATRQVEMLNIVSVDTKYYTTDSNDSIVETVPTRADDDRAFDINTVTLRVGDTKGFALLSTHPKINRVFFYTENGSLADTAYHSPVERYRGGNALLCLSGANIREAGDTCCA